MSKTTGETPQGLHDVQGYPDTRGVSLKKVGVRGVEMPIRLLQKDGGTQTVSARVAMGVYLPQDVKGTHMSRFIIRLNDWSKDKIFSLNMRELLSDIRQQLDSAAAYIDLEFFYYVDKKSPVTDHSAPMGYRCSFHGLLENFDDGKDSSDQEQYHLTLGTTIPVSTLCPCSKAISDYGAHNQRAEIRTQAIIDTREDHPVLWIEDMIASLEETASCPVYPILKRADEKYVTERQYDNPKFVEDVVRDATLLLRNYPDILGFAVEVEALESIHGHNAWAYHEENFGADHRRPWFV